LHFIEIGGLRKTQKNRRVEFDFKARYGCLEGSTRKKQNDQKEVYQRDLYRYKQHHSVVSNELKSSSQFPIKAEHHYRPSNFNELAIQSFASQGRKLPS